ncbi:UNVERIFIED_CONTAM: two-component sensor histidine kinase, partial [Salmonella enterica subsp. enterica serovar Weltevreden]
YLLVGAGVGLLTRLRARRLLAETPERALLEAPLISQRERAATAALAERARIARDLHDVLAHSLGALTLQLDAAAALAQARRWEGLDARIDRA